MYFVPRAGLEPALRKELDLKSSVSTNFTTRAISYFYHDVWVLGIQLEAQAGIEPAHDDFADRSVSTSPLGL